MKFDPKTDKEIAEENLLPKGEYDYEVAEAKEARSKSGNEMIALTLHVFHGESHRSVKDYLLGSMPGKLKHFCDQHGLQREYETGTLTAEDCEGRSSKVLIGIEIDKSGTYPDKNKVVDYLVAKKQAAAAAPTSSGEFAISDDDVPF